MNDFFDFDWFFSCIKGDKVCSHSSDLLHIREGGTRGTHKKRFILLRIKISKHTRRCKASSRNNNNNNNGRRRRRRSEDRSERVALVVEVLQRSATTTLSLFFVEVQARERDGTSDERVRNITSKRRRRSGRTRRGRRKKARR